MQIRQNRRDFLASASLAAAAGVLGAHEAARRRGAAGDDDDPPGVSHHGHLLRAARTSPRTLLRAEGFTDIQYRAGRSGLRSVADGRTGRARFRRTLRRRCRLSAGCRLADHARWPACTPAATSCSRASRSAPSAT